MLGLLRLAQTIQAALAADRAPLEWVRSGGEHELDEVWAAQEPEAGVSGAGWIINRHDGGESWDFMLLDEVGEVAGLGTAATVAAAKLAIERERARRFSAKGKQG